MLLYPFIAAALTQSIVFEIKYHVVLRDPLFRVEQVTRDGGLIGYSGYQTGINDTKTKPLFISKGKVVRKRPKLPSSSFDLRWTQVSEVPAYAHAFERLPDGLANFPGDPSPVYEILKLGGPWQVLSRRFTVLESTNFRACLLDHEAAIPFGTRILRLRGYLCLSLVAGGAGWFLLTADPGPSRTPLTVTQSENGIGASFDDGHGRELFWIKFSVRE